MTGRRAAWLATAMLLAACSRSGEAPGALSAEDERGLNEAAAMLDANAVATNAGDDPEQSAR